MSENVRSSEWWDALLHPLDYLDESVDPDSATQPTLRVVAQLRSHAINPRTALQVLDYCDAHPAADEGPSIWLMRDLARAVSLRSISPIESLSAVELAAERLPDIAGPADSQVFAAAIKREAGISALLSGDLSSADTDLQTSADLRDGTLGDDPELCGSLAITSFLLREARSADEWIAKSIEAEEQDAPGIEPVAIARLMLATERADVDAGHRAMARLASEPRAGSEWRTLWLGTRGYFRSRESRYSAGLDDVETAVSESFNGTLGGFWTEWFRLIRSYLFMRIGRSNDGWMLVEQVTADDRHLVCPGRALAGLRLRLNDVEGAHLALLDCIEVGDRHVPRSRATVRWMEAAISFSRGAFRHSDSESDLALFSMSRNETLAPLGCVPSTLGLRLLERARKRMDPAYLPFVELAHDYYAQHPDRPISPLTAREREVLETLCVLPTLSEVATALFVSPATVKTHVRTIYKKLGVTRRADAIEVARWLGIDSTFTVSSAPAPSEQSVRS